jgi:hypothetical protein
MRGDPGQPVLTDKKAQSKKSAYFLKKWRWHPAPWGGMPFFMPKVGTHWGVFRWGGAENLRRIVAKKGEKADKGGKVVWIYVFYSERGKDVFVNIDENMLQKKILLTNIAGKAILSQVKHFSN